MRSAEEAGENGRLAEWQLPLLKRIASERGTTSLIVTHDPRIMNLADRIVHMERGRIESNVVVAERLFVRAGLRQSPAFAAVLPRASLPEAARLTSGSAQDPAHRELGNAVSQGDEQLGKGHVACSQRRREGWG